MTIFLDIKKSLLRSSPIYDVLTVDSSWSNLSSISWIFMSRYITPATPARATIATTALTNTIALFKLWLHYAKRSLMSWVVVIPKEGRGHRAAPALLLVWHRLFKKRRKKNQTFSKYSKKSVSYPSILLLVWQRFRTLGTFLHTAAHLRKVVVVAQILCICFVYVKFWYHRLHRTHLQWLLSSPP